MFVLKMPEEEVAVVFGIYFDMPVPSQMCLRQLKFEARALRLGGGG